MEWCLWVYRQIYWCRRAIVKQFCPDEKPYEKIHVHSDSLPWFWVGMKYSDEDSVTVTEAVNHSIQYGTRVTPTFLTRLTGYSGGTWKYMDSKTLEEKDFPSEGLIIEDVIGKSISGSE
jgi:hypothetical protein